MPRRPPLIPPPDDTPLCRIGVLCARWPRQPFTMQLTEFYRSLDRLPVYNRIDMMGLALPFEGGSGPTYVAYFPAVCDAIDTTDDATDADEDATTASTTPTKRFLRFDDHDTTRLLHRNPDDWRELPHRYFLWVNEIRREANLLATLADAVGKKAHEWTPQEGEIHVLALVCYKHNSNSSTTPTLADWTPSSRYSFGSDADRLFHSVEMPMPREAQLVRVLEHATSSNGPFSALPAFDRIVFRRRRCQCVVRKASDPPPARQTTPRTRATARSPPPLLQLTEDAVFHALLTHPPQCLDPVDCVVDGSLYLGDSTTPVLDNVLCLLKFKRSEPCNHEAYNSRWGQYVNSSMVDTLDQMALAADPFRPRLLVFVDDLSGRDEWVQREGLPTAMPSVVVSEDIECR